MKFSPRAALVAVAATLALTIPGAGAANAAPGDPLVVDDSGAALVIQPGLISTAAVRITNNSTDTASDVYLTYRTDPADAGLQLPPSTNTTYYDPTCSQPGGVGAEVVCGPYTLAPGQTIGRNLAYKIRSDFLLDYGQTPFTIVASASSATLGFDSETISISQKVASDLYMQTTMNVVDTGTALPERPVSSGVHANPVYSPQDKDIQWIITQGGYSDVADVQATLEIPADVTLRAVPDGCTLSGSTLTCVIDRFPSAVFATIVVPITVNPDLPADTVIPISSPTVTLTSPNEPAGSKTVWTASVVGAPWSLVVQPSVDLAVTHTRVADFSGGDTVDLPITFSNLDTLNDATNAVGTVSLAGLDLTSVSTDIPGCTVTGSDLSCALGTLAAGASVSGTVTVGVPQVDSGTLTLSASITSDTAERDTANNSLVAEYVLGSTEPNVDPTPTPPVVDPTPVPTVDPTVTPTVTPSPTPSSTTNTADPVSNTVLARTGAQVATAALIALLLLVGGTALVIARRRRHQD